MASVQPNRYSLQNSDGSTKVVYETSSLIGQPTLSLTEGGAAARNFSGAQIRVLATEIGSLVSVTTRMTIDTGSTSFSVLIPAISLPSLTSRQAFTTDAIVTSHSGPDSIPSTGVHERYQFIACTGEASFVLALEETVLKAAAASK